MKRFCCLCVLAALTVLLGCNYFDDSPQWLHPRQCAIKNGTKAKVETVVLRLVVEKWEIVPISLLPGETKVVALPDGKIPNMVMLGWDDSPQDSIRALMYLDAIDLDYQGDILFTIYDREVSLPKVETVDLDKLGINREEASAPDDVPNK